MAASLLSHEIFRSPSTSNSSSSRPLRMRRTQLDNPSRPYVAPRLDPRMLSDDRAMVNLLTQEEVLVRLAQHNYFTNGTQHEITPYMRDVVTEWMLDVCREENADAEVFPLAVSLLDRFLSMVDIFKTQLQTLATTCLFVASKVKLPQPFSGRKLAAYTADSIAAGELVSWELLLLSRLDWNVATPTAFDFMERLLFRIGQSSAVTSQIREDCSQMFPAVARDYHLATLPPSVQAAMCMCASALRRCPNQKQAALAVHKIQKCVTADPTLISQLVEIITARCFHPESPTPFMFVDGSPSS